MPYVWELSEDRPPNKPMVLTVRPCLAALGTAPTAHRQGVSPAEARSGRTNERDSVAGRAGA